MKPGLHFLPTILAASRDTPTGTRAHLRTVREYGQATAGTSATVTIYGTSNGTKHATRATMPRPHDRRDSVMYDATRRLRIQTLGQIHRTWWPDGRIENTLRTLRRWAARDLLDVFETNVRPELPLDAPVIDWKRGDQTPDFGRAAWAFASRWHKEAPRRTIVCAATAAAVRIYGGVTPKIVPSQLSHDLHVTAVYLRLRELDPNHARRWVGEDRFRHYGLFRGARGESNERVVPDAVILRRRKSIAIEFATGAYDKRRLRDIHEELSSNEQLAGYQVW